MQGKYKEKVNKKLEELREFNDMDVEQVWNRFREIVIKSAEEACGVNIGSDKADRLVNRGNTRASNYKETVWKIKFSKLECRKL